MKCEGVQFLKERSEEEEEEGGTTGSRDKKKVRCLIFVLNLTSFLTLSLP